MPSPKVRLNIEVTEEERKALKAIALEIDTSLTAIARELFKQYIKECLSNPKLPSHIKEKISDCLRD